ncbi:MAG TPA: PilZ domain-containing protein [Abditibacteriaceae bacterium]|jgi:hypothetical protein
MNMPADNRNQLAFTGDRRRAQREAADKRRRSERLDGPWVAQVRGRDASGRKFTESTVLQNVSASGLYVNLRHSVAPGTPLFVVFTFSTIALHDAPVPKVAARGEVRRIENRSEENIYGVGIQFRHHRFL